jgi:hypothetical protein
MFTAEDVMAVQRQHGLLDDGWNREVAKAIVALVAESRAEREAKVSKLVEAISRHPAYASGCHCIQCSSLVECLSDVTGKAGA